MNISITKRIELEDYDATVPQRISKAVEQGYHVTVICGAAFAMSTKNAREVCGWCAGRAAHEVWLNTVTKHGYCCSDCLQSVLLQISIEQQNATTTEDPNDG